MIFQRDLAAVVDAKPSPREADQRRSRPQEHSNAFLVPYKCPPFDPRRRIIALPQRIWIRGRQSGALYLLYGDFSFNSWQSGGTVGQSVSGFPWSSFYQGWLPTCALENYS